MTRINWSSEARRDLRAIAEYHEATSPSYAKSVVRLLYKAVSRLEEFPRSGRIVPELQMQDYRESLSDGYRTIYLVQLNAVEILAIAHSRQDLHKKLQRRD